MNWAGWPSRVIKFGSASSFAMLLDLSASMKIEKCRASKIPKRVLEPALAALPVALKLEATGWRIPLRALWEWLAAVEPEIPAAAPIVEAMMLRSRGRNQ